MAVPDDVLAFYASGAEDERLLSGEPSLEFLRTQELVSRFLAPGSRVIDIGGATGRYAEWLAAEGHAVELVEPAPSQADAARRRAGEPPRFGVHLADALALPFGDSCFDAALLLGPLYHLPERDARIAALREATRVCRTGGVVAGAAISRFAPLLNVVTRGTVADDSVLANVAEETASGRRVPAERRNSAFPDAWFHLPEELAAEVAEAGLVLECLVGVEGLGCLVPDLDAWLAEPALRKRLLDVARLTERDPHVLAVTPHLLAVARVP
jgi:SAM-dependent methyltransferase